MNKKDLLTFNQLVSMIDYLDQDEGKSNIEIEEYINANYIIPQLRVPLISLIDELMDEE